MVDKGWVNEAISHEQDNNAVWHICGSWFTKDFFVACNAIWYHFITTITNSDTIINVHSQTTSKNFQSLPNSEISMEGMKWQDDTNWYDYYKINKDQNAIELSSILILKLLFKNYIIEVSAWMWNNLI